MKKFLLILTTLLITPSIALAFSGDISVSKIRFSDSNFLEGKTVKIYATATNLSNKDILGVIRFFDNDQQVGADQAISVTGGSIDEVFINWTPGFGSHKIAVKFYPWESEIDNPANNWAVQEVFVVQDTDHDGIPNEKDEDDDGDGIDDKNDAFPLNSKEQYDTDGDGIGDNADLDDDNDDVPDEFDEMPLNSEETMDTDKDGIGNIADTDDDNDGIEDSEEEKLGTNPIKADTDEDGISDSKDPFPTNAAEWEDTDNDGIGNNTDTDDDNDGIIDVEDDFPLNKSPEIAIDGLGKYVPLFERYTFDASSSIDADGSIVSYIWKINGQTYEGNALNYNFDSKGQHEIELTITDDQGQSITKQFQVNAINLNLYTRVATSMLAILLAIALVLKYIAPVSKKTKSKKSSK